MVLLSGKGGCVGPIGLYTYLWIDWSGPVFLGKTLNSYNAWYPGV